MSLDKFFWNSKGDSNGECIQSCFFPCKNPDHHKRRKNPKWLEGQKEYVDYFFRGNYHKKYFTYRIVDFDFCYINTYSEKTLRFSK